MCVPVFKYNGAVVTGVVGTLRGKILFNLNPGINKTEQDRSVEKRTNKILARAADDEKLGAQS